MSTSPEEPASAATASKATEPIEPKPGAEPQRATPEPMETNDVLIVGVGTALFAAAFVVLLALHGTLQHSGRGQWTWIALSGFVLGLLGLAYCRRRARRLHKRDA